MTYPVVEVFHSVQGEGAHAGRPMAFVRLAGCSVRACHIRRECDEAPWRATEHLTAAKIIDRVLQLQAHGRVCITGGEPTDHDLGPLVDELKRNRFLIHIETSGVRALDQLFDWVTVSPKMRGFRQTIGDELKLIVRPDWIDPWQQINQAAESTKFQHYYLQPLYLTDGKPSNLDQVVALVCSPQNDGRWAVSEQRHKSWGVR